MHLQPSLRRVIPSTLGVAMLAVVIAAALTPNVGAVPAQASCQYGSCPTTPNYTPYVYTGIGLAVLAAIVGALLILRRRRGGAAASFAGKPSGGGPGPLQEYQEPEGPMPAEPTDFLEEPYPPAAPAPEVAPEIPPPAPTPPPGATGSDIDSLMDELDKISSEILKKGTPKQPPKDPDQPAG